jgi:hypothetical protein
VLPATIIIAAHLDLVVLLLDVGADGEALSVLGRRALRGGERVDRPRRFVRLDLLAALLARGRSCGRRHGSLMMMIKSGLNDGMDATAVGKLRGK